MKAGTGAGSAQPIAGSPFGSGTTDIKDSVSTAKYFHSKINVSPNIEIGGEELHGSATNVAYATTDGTGAVKTEDVTESSQWNIRWDGKTLTLKDATITNADGSGILYEKTNSPIEIVLEGDNTVTSNANGSTNTEKHFKNNGIYSGSDLTISGDGSLVAKGTSYGIRVGEALTTIESGTIEATGGRYGIANYSGNITISGGTVTATATEVLENPDDYGVLSNGISSTNGNIIISGAGTVVTAKGQKCGIQAVDGNITISGGEITATATGSSKDASGIDAEKSITISGGEVTAEGQVYGIQVPQGNITISGGEVTATATGSGEGARGIYARDSITVSPQDGKVIAAEEGENEADAKTLQASPFAGEAAITPSGKYFHSAAYDEISITTQPTGQTVTEGGTAQFSVTADTTATGTLAYQWQQSNDNGATWTDIDGAEESTYTTEAAKTAMSGTRYRCIVTRTAGGTITGMGVSDAAALTVNRASAGSSGDSGRAQQNFWEDVEEKLAEAAPGDTVKANARGFDQMPYWVMEALGEAEGVTLHLTWNGGEDIVIPASAALTPEAGRIYYPLSYLEGMAFPAAAPENPETGGVLEVTAPVQAVQPQVTAPDQGLTEAPAVIEETPEVLEETPEALPGVTEPQEGASESAPAASGGGLMFAGAAAVLAAAVIGLLLWRSRKGEGEGR